jgi:hypothetical protein
MPLRYGSQIGVMSSSRTRLTERLRLDPIHAGHADDLYALFADPAVAEW